MKKSIIALAVAASMVGVAQADNNTTLYGSLRTSLEYNSASNLTDGGVLSVVDQASRFGIKGSEDLGNGLTAIYNYEFGVNTGMANIKSNDRLSFVGLTGGFGTFAIGKQWSPMYTVLGYNDIFNGSSSYALYQGVFRLGNAVAYVTPNMGGFTGIAAVVTDGTQNNLGDHSDYTDAFNVAAQWTANGLLVGASYLESASIAGTATTPEHNLKLAGGVVGYKNDMFQIGFVFVDNMKGEANKDVYNYDLTGEFYLNQADTLRAGIAALDYQASGYDNVYQYEFGYEHKFSKRTLAWVEYAYTDNGNNADNTNLVSVGLRTDF